MKDQKILLFERMKYLNSDFKYSINESEINSIDDLTNTNNNPKTEKEIIDDILSINESVGNILSKISDYGRKGLLTATIILSVAGAVASGIGNGVTLEQIIKTGADSINNNQKIELYSAFVGLANKMTDTEFKQRDYDRAGAFKEIAMYYADLRDGKTPLGLSDNAKKYETDFFKVFNKFKNDDYAIKQLIDSGKTIKYSPPPQK